MSINGLKNWKLIYEGKRAIKDSMIWIAEERALLYSEYTPGLDLQRHHLYKYFIDSGETRMIMTFYSPEEHERDNSNPYCRHIHILKRDPFSNDIYMGVGDSDDESAVYRSTDNGNTFTEVGHGSHFWRTLSFMFTENHIYWNTDSPDPQYINCLERSIVDSGSFVNSEVRHYPLYGGACWNTIYDNNNNLYIMSANCEGALHDNRHRVYGIEITENKLPTVYCLYEENVDMSE